MDSENETEENREETVENREETEEPQPITKIIEQPKIDVLRKKKKSKTATAKQLKGLEKARRTKELKKMLKEQQPEPPMEQPIQVISSFTKHLPMLGISLSILGVGYLLTKSMRSKMNTLQQTMELERNYNPKEMVENLMDLVQKPVVKLEQKSPDIIENSVRPTKLQLNF